MPAIVPSVPPYTIQQDNPANVLQVASAPSSAILSENKLGTIAVINSTGAIYILASKSGNVDTWKLLSVSSGVGVFSTVTSAGTITATNGNVVLGTAGNKLSIATGTNASIGTSAAMTAGTITISTTAVTASSKIFLTANTLGGTPGTLSAPTASIVAGTSFVITSSSNTDTSTVNWWIVN